MSVGDLTPGAGGELAGEAPDASEEPAANQAPGPGPERDDLLAQQARELQAAVEEAAALRRRLDRAETETVDRLARAVAARCRETYEHLERVGKLAGAICAHLERAPDPCDAVATAAKLHDVGKVAIPDAILLKEGPLDTDERAQIERHTEIGHMVLSGSGGLLELAATVALSHHERFDGEGYPQGLAGKQIPFAARVCAVADVFDALTMARPYRPAFDRETAFEILEQERGGAFDPEIVDAFAAAIERAEAIKRELPDGAIV